MENGLEKSAEEIHARLTTREWPRQKIARCGGNHYEAGGEKATSAEKNAGKDANRKTGEGQYARRNASGGESVDGPPKHPTKGPSQSFNAHSEAPRRH
jgi:hypothetical protein